MYRSARITVVVVGVLLAVQLLLTGCGAPKLSEVDLEPLLIQSGDLPAGFSGSQVRDRAPDMFKEVPTPQKAISQQLQRNGSATGTVTVLLYDSADDVAKAYSLTAAGLSTDRVSLADVGEEAVGIGSSQQVAGIKIEFADLVFLT